MTARGSQGGTIIASTTLANPSHTPQASAVLAQVAGVVSAPVFPVISLDFANGVYTDTNTIAQYLANSNSTGGYVTNSDGTLTFVSANTLRVGVGMGLLQEASSTNQVQQSQTFDTTWVPTACSISADATTAPDGTTTADKIVEDSTNNVHQIAAALASIGSAAPVTVSVYFKASGRTWAYIQVNNSPLSAAAAAFFDLSNGVVGSIVDLIAGFTNKSSTIYALANGWYRCTFTLTSVSGDSNASVFLGPGSADTVRSYTGDGSSGVFGWGAQLENTTFASSYIPTTGSTATRSADVISCNSDLDNALSLSALTIYGKALRCLDGGSVPSDGSVPGAIISNGTTGAVTLGDRDNTGATLSEGLNSVTFAAETSAMTLSTWQLFAAAYQASNYGICLNGGSVGTSGAAQSPVASTSFTIGDSASPFNGYFSQLVFYNSRLSDALLQSLTTSSSAQTISANLTGISALIAASVMLQRVAATLSQSSTLSAATVMLLRGTATLSQISTLSANASHTPQGTALLANVSALAAGTSLLMSTTAVLAVTSTLSANATIPPSSSSAVLAESLSVLATLLQNFKSTAVLAESSSLIANAVQNWLTTSVLAESSTLAANVTHTPQGTAALAETSALAANVTHTPQGTALLASVSNLIVATNQLRSTTSVLSSSSVLTAIVSQLMLSSTVLASSANVAANATHTPQATALLANTNNLISSAVLRELATATLPMTSTLSAFVTIQGQATQWQGSAVLTGVSNLLANLTQMSSTVTVLPVASSLTTVMNQLCNATAQVYAAILVRADAKAYLATQAGLVASGNIDAMVLQNWATQAEIRSDLSVDATVLAVLQSLATISGSSDLSADATIVKPYSTLIDMMIAAYNAKMTLGQNDTGISIDVASSKVTLQ